MLSSVVNQYFLIFVAGIAGSFHCIGMCGGFACALGENSQRKSFLSMLERHLLYNVGRLSTYIFLGALAGLLGQSLTTHGVTDGISGAQRLLAIIAGALMIVMAFQLFGLWRKLSFTKVSTPINSILVPIKSLLAAPHKLAPLSFGVFNGFLPCPLVYAFVAKAASSGEILMSLFIMLAFGLGTFPAMLMMGGLGYRLSAQWRKYGVWLAGGFILIFGLITLLRGIFPLVEHGHA